MPALFRRHSNIQCFFCQSPVPYPANIRNFKCTSCGCWNRYDQRGEITSDEPAMHEERLNSRSFAKRASPSKDRLPTMYGPGPFCHSCQTNQMLIVNLLSNYLPASESPEYESRLEMLPAYQESLHARYPPVCDSCLPQVQEEIRRKEQMARVQALGGWLSKGKERQRRVSGPDIEREKVPLFWWKVRGCLWAFCLAVSMIGSLSAANGRYPFSRFAFLHPILPLLVGISVLWTAWDPTYASFRKAQLQGRDVRVQGKHTYNKLQILAWATRLISSINLCFRWFHPYSLCSRLDGPWAEEYRIYFLMTFTVEMIAIIGSCYVLRIQQPPSIRLVDTHSHKLDKSRSSTPIPGATPITSNFPPDHDVLASLSLSSKPVIGHPVFGLPSLQGVSTPTNVPKEEVNGDEMDWTPTNPEACSAFGKRAAATSSQNDNWLRPQRFFAPEKPTGLEGLFESTRLQDEPMPFQKADGRREPKFNMAAKHLRKWGPLYTFLIALSLASINYTLKWLGLMKWAF